MIQYVVHSNAEDSTQSVHPALRALKSCVSARLARSEVRVRDSDLTMSISHVTTLRRRGYALCQWRITIAGKANGVPVKSAVLCTHEEPTFDEFAETNHLESPETFNDRLMRGIADWASMKILMATRAAASMEKQVGPDLSASRF